MSAQPTANPAGKPQATGKARRIKIALLVSATLVAAVDLGTKALAEALLANGATVDLGLVNLKMLYNTGIAFSLGADLAPWLVIAATGLIIAALVWYTVSSASLMTGLSRAGSALLLGGAIGNFIDRLDGRGVVDYLHSGWFPTFNLADVFVTTGVTLLVLGTIIRQRPHTRGQGAVRT